MQSPLFKDLKPGSRVLIIVEESMSRLSLSGRGFAREGTHNKRPLGVLSAQEGVRMAQTFKFTVVEVMPAGPNGENLHVTLDNPGGMDKWSIMQSPLFIGKVSPGDVVTITIEAPVGRKSKRK
jgi:hypothetical protein